MRSPSDARAEQRRAGGNNVVADATKKLSLCDCLLQPYFQPQEGNHSTQEIFALSVHLCTSLSTKVLFIRAPICKRSEESKTAVHSTASAYISAVLRHVGGNVVVMYTWSFRVDAGEALVVRARIVISVPRVERWGTRALATVSAVVTLRIIETTTQNNEAASFGKKSVHSVPQAPLAMPLQSTTQEEANRNSFERLSIIYHGINGCSLQPRVLLRM